MTLEDIIAAVEKLRALPKPLPEASVHESENAPDGLYLSVATDEGAQRWREALKGTPAPLPVVSRELPKLHIERPF